MNRQPVIAAALVAIALCAGPLASAPALAQQGPACNETNHCVDVTVVGGKIQPLPDVTVSGKNHQIWWQLKTPGYSFPKPPKSDGVFFKPASSGNDNGKMPAKEFNCNRVSATVFHCTNANSTNGQRRKYQYGVTVVEDASGKDITLDPWVVNL